MKQIIEPVVLKKDAIKAAGNNAAALARQLGITRAAVCLWPEVLHPYRARQVLDLYPELRRK